MPKKIMNLPEDCVSEAMEGFLAANKDYVQAVSYTHLTLPTIA